MHSYKTRRKLSKYRQILKSELNINASEEPSKNLMIGNAGLVSGMQYEQLAKLFTQYGTVEKIIMIPRRSYSFVVFSTIRDAAEAYSGINGQVTLEKMDGPMYLLYTESVPTQFDSSVSQSLPQGLTLLNDFVSSEEEERLLSFVSWDMPEKDTAKNLKHRRVKHFGYEFRYDINNVDKNCPLSEGIPLDCTFIWSKLEELGQPLPWIPDQLTVNQYQKGQGIPSHIDTHSAFESPLLSLSLGSDIVMEFRLGPRHVPVLLPRRSLLIMDCEARYAWSHGITPRMMDVVSVAGGLSVCERGCRTSFTLRKVREGPCHCKYPEHCDSQVQANLPVIPECHASKLEELYVHKVYNNIASHFSETRTKIWPNVQDFLLSFPPGAILVDAGCGNGKYFGVNTNIFQVGFDRSAGLAEITRARDHEVFVSDCLMLPLRNGVADGMISIAVLHHLSTRERRLQALREMTRVLVTSGRALITVWAKDQTKQNKTSYLKQDRKNRRNTADSQHGTEEPTVSACENVFSEGSAINKTNFLEKCVKEKSFKNNPISQNSLENENKSNLRFELPVHRARTEFQHQDVFVPWKVKPRDPNQSEKEVFLRYYHVFEENELMELCSTLTDIDVLQTYYTEGNWCVIFKKVDPKHS